MGGGGYAPLPCGARPFEYFPGVQVGVPLLRWSAAILHPWPQAHPQSHSQSPPQAFTCSYEGAILLRSFGFQEQGWGQGQGQGQAVTHWSGGGGGGSSLPLFSF